MASTFLWVVMFPSLFVVFFVFILIRKGFGSRKRNQVDDEKRNSSTSIRVSFLHPDLGIGGAENLIVNAAVVLKKRGHSVRLYTAHHDPSHCFEETRDQGILADCVFVHGDWLPRTLFGRMAALCAMFRMTYLAMVLLFSNVDTDVYICDQVSIPIPILRLSGKPVLFYCHFPDKLLCTQRKSMWKRFYRLPVDFIEEITTGAADEIMVNSHFTASVFASTFSLLSHLQPKVLYPPIDPKQFLDPPCKKPCKEQDSFSSLSSTIYITSLNRFERKKNIILAADAMKIVQNKISPMQFSKVKLIIAGGYDPLNKENIEHLEELKERVKQLGLLENVEFRTSISSEEKLQLLYQSRFIVYTPDNEHFGIVPVEAMCTGTPVIAVASGGPLETIVHEETGFLCKNDATSFATAYVRLLGEDGQILAKQLGSQGKKRAQQLFSLETFGNILESTVKSLYYGDDLHQQQLLHCKKNE